jgi:hypothetical protein
MEPGGKPFFRIHPLRLFDREVSGHLVDSGRHPVGQSPLNREIRGMTRLSRGKFGRLLFGALLGRGKLRLERFDMGFERSYDLIGERSFVDNTSAQSTIV